MSALKAKETYKNSHLYKLVEASIARNCQENKVEEPEVLEFIQKQKVEDECRILVS